MKKIILSGYMGSGKSTVARLLHQKTGLKSFDLDELIEEKAAKSISEIFASQGEIQFRRLEHDMLEQVLNDSQDIVLSLGGGTPCYANNHILLKGENIIWIYLKASPETLYKRLAADNEKRPVLNGKAPEEMKEFIAKHLFDRSYYYNQADHKITTDGKSPEAIAEEIANWLA
jgi:shikimate kinase